MAARHPPSHSPVTSHVSLPMTLPPASLVVVSHPGEDLAKHMQFHGIHHTAREPSASALTILREFVGMNGGEEELLDETRVLLRSRQQRIRQQLSKRTMPTHVWFAKTLLDSSPPNSSAIVPPKVSHLLALSSSIPGASTADGVIVPIHAHIYALQCVSLPSLHVEDMRTSTQTATSASLKDGFTLPLVRLAVPRPHQFYMVHEYLYSHSALGLLAHLLPAGAVCVQVQPKSVALRPQGSVNMALLRAAPTQELLGEAWLVHAAWVNGVAIGLLDKQYWIILSEAWSLLVKVLSTREGVKQSAENDESLSQTSQGSSA